MVDKLVVRCRCANRGPSSAQFIVMEIEGGGMPGRSDGVVNIMGGPIPAIVQAGGAYRFEVEDLSPAAGETYDPVKVGLTNVVASWRDRSGNVVHLCGTEFNDPPAMDVTGEALTHYLHATRFYRMELFARGDGTWIQVWPGPLDFPVRVRDESFVPDDRPHAAEADFRARPRDTPARDPQRDGPDWRSWKTWIGLAMLLFLAVVFCGGALAMFTDILAGLGIR